MKIVNDALTRSFLRHGNCRYCGKGPIQLCAAHIFAKGHGGGRQVDIPCNLIALGMNPIFDCQCHHNSHQCGDPSQAELLMVSAADHKCEPRDIEDLVRLIQRMPKIEEMTVAKFVEWVDSEIDRPSTRALARRELKGFKHLLAG